MHFKLISILLLIAGSLLAQFSISPRVQDFRVSVDNQEASFIQENPLLFFDDSEKFIVTWTDHRNGLPKTYAQIFDSLGNKSGNNFIILGNNNISLNKNSFLTISENYYSSQNEYWDLTSLYFSGTIYDNERNVIKDNIDLGGGWLPWCGTGFLGVFNKFSPINDGFIYALNFDGEVSYRVINNSGEIINQFSFSELVGSYGINSVSFFQKANKYIIGWTNFNGWGYDTTAGAYVTLIDVDNLTDKQNIILEKFNSDSYDNIKQIPEIEILPLSDSTSIIFYSSIDSLNLNVVTLNHNTPFKFNKKIFRISEIFPSSNLESQTLESYSIISYQDSLFMSVLTFYGYNLEPDYRIIYTQIILIANSKGELLHSYIKENLEEKEFETKPFFISSTYSFSSKIINNDVYLVKKNIFETIDSSKINDDQTGSNERAPQISITDEGNYLVGWNNESSTFSRFFDNNGLFISEQFNSDSKKYVFFKNNIRVSTWKIPLPNYKAQIGFKIYNDNWDIIFSDSLISGDNYYSNAVIKKISDDKFAILYSSDKIIKIRLYDISGSMLKEVLVDVVDYIHGLQMIEENTTSFWVKWSYNLQLFSNDLNKISEKIEQPMNLYLGKGKLLLSYGESPNKIVGFILTLNGDTLVNKFTIAESVDINSIKFLRISDTKFLALYSKLNDKCYYGRIILDDGTIESIEFGGKIYNKEFKVSSNPNIADLFAAINGNDLVFTWADLREGNLGYDIYCNIYDLDKITGIKIYDNGNPIINEFSLSQNYPNPFNPTTTINYTIPNVASGFSPSQVTLVIYNTLGEEIKTLVNEQQFPGNYSVIFDANNLSSGIYYYQLKFGSFVETKKMILLR